MIYADTRRPFWGVWLTAPKFFGATLVLGTAAAALASACIGHTQSAPILAAATLALRVALFGWGRLGLSRSGAKSAQAMRRAVRTVSRLLSWVPPVALALFFISFLASFPAIFSHGDLAVLARAVVLCSTFAAALIERFCFFATCPAPRMPGGLSA
jgi:DMSO reductase anchor subunit